MLKSHWIVIYPMDSFIQPLNKPDGSSVGNFVRVGGVMGLKGESKPKLCNETKI